MENEYETRVLDIDVEETEKKLLEIGAIKEGEFFQKRKLCICQVKNGPFYN